MRNRSLFAVCGIAVGVLAGVAGASEQVVVTASKDATLYEDAEGDLSNGGGDHFFVGRSGQNTGTARRGLLAFDLTGLLPDDAVILNVRLRLHMSLTSSLDQTQSLHRLLADWGEGNANAPGGEGGGAAAQIGDATWLHTFYADQFWTNPGGDFDPTISASTVVSWQTDFYSWSDDQMVADVEGWIADPSSNFGWLLMGDESMLSTTKRYDSIENENIEYRPVLIINYVPAPSALALLGLGLMAPRRRRH